MQKFFYSHGKEQPCIQVGKALEDFVFWLAYNDEEIAKCASRLLKAYGPQLGISDLHNAKRLLLGFVLKPSIALMLIFCRLILIRFVLMIL